MPVYIQFALATWGALFFGEIGVTDLGRSASLASLQGIVAPVGLITSGLLADALHRRGVHRKVVIAAALACAAASCAAMAAVMRAQGSPLALTLLMLAASFSIWSTWGPAYALFGGMFPPSVLGRAFGLFNCVCFVGSIVGPHLTGWIRDLTGSLAAGLFTAGGLALGAAALALALGAERLEPAAR
jgi:MFS family permease